MATLHVLPNMTWSARPHALVENVVPAATPRGRGYGRTVMSRAIAAARDVDCCKIMLLTGHGGGVDAGARGFYETLGFSATQKHGRVLRRVPTRPAAQQSAPQAGR